MSGNRLIDRKRDAALSLQIGTAEDSSAVTEMISTDRFLYAVTEKSIYAIQLADQIDPDRKNATIPPAVQQQVLSYGASDELVGRMFLTANKLFDSPYLPHGFNRKRALELSFDALREVVAMRDLLLSFEADQKSAADAFTGRVLRGDAFVMPAVVDASQRFKGFTQKADHALQNLFDIVKLFYGGAVEKGWYLALLQHATNTYGKDDFFVRYLTENLPLLRFIRNMRNCIEHPKPNKKVVVTDFAIGGEGTIDSPKVEVACSEFAQAPITVTTFMNHLVTQISQLFESICVLLCAKHVQPFAGFQFQVVELPEDMRTNRFVRYSYGLDDGQRIIPAG